MISSLHSRQFTIKCSIKDFLMLYGSDKIRKKTTTENQHSIERVFREDNTNEKFQLRAYWQIFNHKVNEMTLNQLIN